MRSLLQTIKLRAVRLPINPFMKRIALLLLATTIYNAAHAQDWEIHIATGTSLGKLLPTSGSTPVSSGLRYGFERPGIFVSPEVNVKLDEHNSITIGYQLSSSSFGTQLTPAGRQGGREVEFDVLTMHNFSIGYSYRQHVAHEHLVLGGFAKAGIALGQLTAIGGGVSSGYSGADQSYLNVSRLSEFEVIPDFWTPTATLGFIVGPNFKDRRLSDRLVLNASATLGFKNPYVAYSQVAYTNITGSFVSAGTLQWQGRPLMVQIGLDYNLFHFSGRAGNSKGLNF